MTWSPPPTPRAELAEVQEAIGRVVRYGLADREPYPRVLAVLQQRRQELQAELRQTVASEVFP